MFINLTEVLTSEEKIVTMQTETALTDVSVSGETFQIVEKTPVRFTFTSLGKGKAAIDGEAEMTFAMQCDRCLKPVDEKLQLSISREVYAPDMEAKTDDENVFMDGYALNVEELLYNEIMIKWPMKVLCKPDCRGICLKCGKDLNTGTCGCDTFVPDPRMAVIKDIFNANKEV